MARPVLILCACVVLGACQTADDGAQARHIPAGSALELHQTLSIPPDRVSVRIQDGKLQDSVDQYRPNCKFEIRTMASVQRAVRPDRFEIQRVRRFAEGVLAGLTTAGIGLFGDGPSYTPYITELYLHSDRQRDVLRLSCQHWQDPAWVEAAHVTVPEIRAALGPVFTLHLAQ